MFFFCQVFLLLNLFVHQCAFHLLKIYHNTNGRFRSSLLVCFRLDQTVLTDRKRLCTIISLLNSYCNFLDLIFTWAVKKTQPVCCTVSFSLTCARVCVCRAHLQAYGLWKSLLYFNTDQNSVIRKSATNWPPLFSLVTDTQWTRTVQRLPRKMLGGLTIKKRGGQAPPPPRAERQCQGLSRTTCSMTPRARVRSRVGGACLLPSRLLHVHSVNPTGRASWPFKPSGWARAMKTLHTGLLGAKCGRSAAFSWHPCNSATCFWRAGGSNGHFGFFGFVFR